MADCNIMAKPEQQRDIQGTVNIRAVVQANIDVN